MIFSKNNLQIVEITKADKNVPVLYNVKLEKDGTSVASSGRSTLLVSPVLEDTRERLENVIEETDPGEMVISSDTVKMILKDLPADKRFGGLLEHCDIEKRGQNCEVRLTDGKRKRKFTGKCYPRDYLPYKKIVGPALQSGNEDGGMKIVLNLKRFIQLLSTIDKICPDTTEESPVWINFTKDGNIVIRSINNINGQRCIGLMTSYKGIEGKWLEPDEWERALGGGNKKVLRKVKKYSILKHKKRR